MKVLLGGTLVGVALAGILFKTLVFIRCGIITWPFC